MTLVRASIDIAAPRERVYDFVLDPGHLDEWVTIHRRLNSRDAGPPREGYEMDQTLHLRGANFKVHWTLTEADRPDRATWEGRGPAHSYARTAYALHDMNGGGTPSDALAGETRALIDAALRGEFTEDLARRMHALGSDVTTAVTLAVNKRLM